MATPAPTQAVTLSKLLHSNKPIVLDGALATYLEILGADISGALWSADLLTSNPSLIKKTHLDYFTAGAHIAITASYQASIPGLVKQLNISEHEAKDLIVKSVNLAAEARSDYLSAQPSGAESRPLWVAGSVGPYATLLADGSEYRGDYVVAKEDMKDFHRGRIAALVEAGVDVLACETIPSLPETQALAELLAAEFPHTEAWFSFTLRDETHISDGASLTDVVKALEGCNGVVAVGLNCVKADVALGAIKQLTKLTGKPLIVYPNSGEDWNAQTRGWEGSRSGGERLAGRTKEYWDAGARLIGGCCRTTPDDIKVIAQTLGDIKPS